MTDHEPTLIHPTYRHIDRPVHICGLTIGQWTRLAVACAVAWPLAEILPFTATYDAAVAITLTGTPLAISFAAGSAAEHPLAPARAWLRWRCRPKLYQAAESRPGATY